MSVSVHKTKTKGKRVTAWTLLDKEEQINIVKLDEMYYIFQIIWDSHAYFDTKKEGCVGSGTLTQGTYNLLLLSAADMKWPQLLISLEKDDMGRQVQTYVILPSGMCQVLQSSCTNFLHVYTA